VLTTGEKTTMQRQTYTRDVMSAKERLVALLREMLPR
jgi:hypothetical protein